jgi:putative DNA methylase
MTSTNKYKKKLIEVAIPLEAINTASAREKSIRHGHPSTLHLWWARRPLAACRAVLFAQLVDDPSGYADTLLESPKIRKQAEADLAVRIKAWRERKADAHGNVPDKPEPTLEDCAADIERKRLFEIIEDLVLWENSTNEEVLERARAEIRRSCGGVLPPVYDPFSGGGSIPLEAQRLGLPAYGSDLNPVAVMIGKAMIEIPPKFKDMPPIHPGIKERSFYRNAEGLAEDVGYYGKWMLDQAIVRAGHLYPQAKLPAKDGGANTTIMAWIWARTVPSPDPAFSTVQVPLISSFVLSNKAGKEAWLRPVVDKANRKYAFEVCTGKDADALANAEFGTKAGRAMFRCILSDSQISGTYIDEMATKGQMSAVPIAIVAKKKNGTVFLSADTTDAKEINDSALQFIADNNFELGAVSSNCRGTFASNAQGRSYGFSTFAEYFSARQLAILLTLSDLVQEVIDKVQSDCVDINSIDHVEYARAVGCFMAFLVSQMTNHSSTMCGWNSANTQMRSTYARQGIAMTWDFAECNLFGGFSGSFQNLHERMVKGFASLGASKVHASITAQDARTSTAPMNSVICTDPPYYDNITYSDLSDYFYVWLKRSIGKHFPDAFASILTPKTDELVAESYRHGGREEAEAYFSTGIQQVIRNFDHFVNTEAPVAIFYAFKQSEIEEEGLVSSGWATFISGIIQNGFEVKGTWPVRTEKPGRVVAVGKNALANSVVLVCRKRELTADLISRAEFIRALKRELPPAIAELQAANIAPADMPQSAIGPGMGVFSRYKAVLEADDSPMSVKMALQLINRELDEYLGGIQGEFDAETRFAITWFEQNGTGKGDYGTADNLARARGISVDSVKHAGIVESAAGKVRILSRDELEDDWSPEEDPHLTVWECLQHLVREYEKDGISHNTAVLLKKIDSKAEAVKDLAYCLYDISANKRKDAKEATAYNALIADWTELTRQAAAIHDMSGDRQIRLNI